MLTKSGPSQPNDALRALDPDLPLLASEAAVEMDNLLAQRTQDLTAMRRLGARLRNSIQIGTAGGPARSLMDRPTLTVLGEAVAEATRSESLQRIEDLLGRAARIADLLFVDPPAGSTDELMQARDFCLALSRAVMAYHRSILDLRPSHPFRR